MCSGLFWHGEGLTSSQIGIALEGAAPGQPCRIVIGGPTPARHLGPRDLVAEVQPKKEEVVRLEYVQ